MGKRLRFVEACALTMGVVARGVLLRTASR